MQRPYNKEYMKIAVIGAGAIGSIVAAYLKKAGKDVVLVGKENQMAQIKNNGLKVGGVRGEEVINVNTATRLDHEYDLVIFTVKTQDIEDAYLANKAFLKKALVLTSQNGVQADHILKQYVAPKKLLSSIVMFGSTYVELGKVTFNFEGDWIVGSPFAKNEQALKSVSDVLKEAFSVVISDDIMGMKWLKLFVNFNNCIPAVTGKSMQETFTDMDLCRLSILLLKEGFQVVDQAGINLVSLPHFPKERIAGLVGMPIEQAAGIVNKTLTTLSKEPLYGSILQSIMRKRTSEIDYINGEVVRLAKELNQEAPLNAQIVEMVHEVEKAGEFFAFEQIKNKFELCRNVTP